MSTRSINGTEEHKWEYTYVRKLSNIQNFKNLQLSGNIYQNL